MKRVLITGASRRGFIGRNLKEALARQYELFTPTHAELELLDTEQVARYVDKNRIEAIVHAAVHVPEFNGPEKEYYNDMLMFWNLHRLSSRVEKILYFGSGAEFDKRDHIRMAKETDIPSVLPVSEYGLAKYTMNRIAQTTDNIYNLRLFGIFGKYELWQIKFISNLCCKAVFNLPLSVRSECMFDFLYIEDLPAIVAWFLENKPVHHDYNVCHGIPYALTKLAAMVNEISGKNLEIHLKSAQRNLDYTGDNSRLRAEIRNLRITPMAQAIAELYGYYQNHRDLIDPGKLKFDMKAQDLIGME
ncbi:MAG: NAD-dependent epimerase/dehydratase family protein [Bacillota bacterium]